MGWAWVARAAPRVQPFPWYVNPTSISVISGAGHGRGRVPPRATQTCWLCVNSVRARRSWLKTPLRPKYPSVMSLRGLGPNTLIGAPPFVPCGVHKTGVVHHVIRVVMGEKQMGDVFGQAAGTDEVVDDAPPQSKRMRSSPISSRYPVEARLV